MTDKLLYKMFFYFLHLSLTGWNIMMPESKESVSETVLYVSVHQSVFTESGVLYVTTLVADARKC